MSSGETKVFIEVSLDKNGAVTCQPARLHNTSCKIHSPKTDPVIRFSEYEVCQLFISKVFALLSGLCMVLIGCCLAFRGLLDLKPLNGDVAIAAKMVLIFLQAFLGLVAYCNRDKWLRLSPYNYITLSAFAILNAALLTVTYIVFKLEKLLFSMKAILLVFVVLAIFACQSRVKYTWSRAMMLAFLILVPILGLVEYYIDDTSNISILVLGIVDFTICSFIILDINLITKGSRPPVFIPIKILPEDYVLTTLMLFLDMAVFMVFSIICFFT